MNFKKLFAVVAVMFASFIQVGCGNATNPNTMGYPQYQSGSCVAGQVLINGVCTYQQNNNAGSCTSGASYPGSSMGCAMGYVMQGNQCVCQANVTPGSTGGGCLQGTFPFMNSCYPQGPCYTGYVYYTPTGMCYKVQ